MVLRFANDVFDFINEIWYLFLYVKISNFSLYIKKLTFCSVTVKQKNSIKQKKERER